jgi:uncharacterized repeat protein (TIGR03803 family)
MRGKTLSIGLRAALAIFTVTLFVTSTWAATETVLHSVNPKFTDGADPYAGLIFDAAGHLYGTTAEGGTYGRGTVFELTPQAGGDWVEQVLYNFENNGIDGSGPIGSLIFDAAGNLYGTTIFGGTSNWGTVFELTPKAGGDWRERVLHNFKHRSHGVYPAAGLIFDAAGNLYGTTEEGGTYGRGTVFELTAQAGGGWTERVLHDFNKNGTDGVDLDNGSLIFDGAGNLYGTTLHGGTYGRGTVFELTPQAGGGWREQVLLSFSGRQKGGAVLHCALIFDGAGNLYGTTFYGGTQDAGTVFELTPQAGGGWTEQVLYSFDYDDKSQSVPQPSGLVLDAAGNLYGITAYGGAQGAGTVFELTPQAGGGWIEQVLYNFDNNGMDGTYPKASLVLDGAGSLYGTTSEGGTNSGGTVFELTPQGGGGWTEKVLYSFETPSGGRP